MNKWYLIAAAVAAYFLIIKRGPQPGQMQRPLSIREFQMEQAASELDWAMRYNP